MKKVFRICYLERKDVCVEYNDYYRGQQTTTETITIFVSMGEDYSSEEDAIKYMVENKMDDCTILPFWIKA